MNFVRNLICGLVIGVANIIPGVSGGTMAVLLGMYDQLIESVSSWRRHFMDSLRLLLPVALGAGSGILLFSRMIKYLLSYFPMATNFFFLGLVFGGIPVIYKRAAAGRFRPLNLLPFAAALCVMIAVPLLSAQSGASGLITALTPVVFIRLTLCGALAAACMILPGVSGSMVMMILGIYTSVLTAISDFNIPLLIPVGIGVLAGLLGGAKVIHLCLKRFPQSTYWAILGLIAGSVLPVARSAGFTPSLEGVFALVTLAAGAAVSLLMARLQNSPAAR